MDERNGSASPPSRRVIRRREFLGRGAAALGAACLPATAARRALAETAGPDAAHDTAPAAPIPGVIFFTSAGRTCRIASDGSDFRTLDFQSPGIETWQPAGFFPDGRRVLLLGMEARRDGPGRPFETHYHKTPTHIFIHDLESGGLEEIATKDRLAPFYTPALLLPGDGRMLVQVVRDEGGNLLSMNLDGSDAREFTKVGEGLPYGLSLSPDGRRVAFHLAGPQGYRIHTSAVDGSDRRLVAADPDLLFFGPAWSPDGEWLAFQGCRFKKDPGHDWADLWIARPDGSELRALTAGREEDGTDGGELWFGASYGPKDRPGGGSNMPSWTRDGRILCSRRLPGSKVPWEFQSNRPDTDHFNREFRPEAARGGSEVCRIDPFAAPAAAGENAVERLTRSEPPVWDFRGVESPDGREIAFCRCAVGESPALWAMRADGSGARRLTDGIDGLGADHPRWLPAGWSAGM